jgi:hypothetical protein
LAVLNVVSGESRDPFSRREVAENRSRPLPRPQFWEAPLDGDLKEVVGTLMRVLGGEKISRREVEDLAFEANGELQLALNRAYIKLLEFAYDCDAGLRGQSLTDEMRAELQHCLREIVRCADPSLTNGNEVKESEA